jgi:hypothetical protein
MSSTVRHGSEEVTLVTGVYHCNQGTIKLRFSLDSRKGDGHMVYPRSIDFSALNLITTKVRIEILPADINQDRLTITVPASEAVEIMGGREPSTETFHKIHCHVCERKRYPLPKAEIPGGGGKSMSAQGQTKKPDAHSHAKHR